MNILFWNVGKKNLESEIATIMTSTHTDILVLAEYENASSSLLRILQQRGIIEYSALSTIGCNRIKVFTNSEIKYFRPVEDADRYSIIEFHKPGHLRLLMAMVHLSSKLYWKEDDQRIEVSYFKSNIERIEKREGHSNTIILGDFNMNPFDPGMISAEAMHSLPCLRTAKSGYRIIKKRKHLFFYNPSWNLLGDRDGVAGTYFYKDSNYISYHWNLLDQVILRPGIADRFDKQSFRIVTESGGVNLLNDNNRPALSDHLPIFFSMNLINEESYEKLMA